MKDNVSVMESELVKAEDQMGSFSGLKKMLSSFVSPVRNVNVWGEGEGVLLYCLILVFIWGGGVILKLIENKK